MDENNLPPHLHRFLARLSGLRREGDGWVAACPCPGHGGGGGDRHPSLAVTLGVGGRVLVTCRVGCTTDEVLYAAGCDWADLFPDSGGGPPPGPVAAGRPAAAPVEVRDAAYTAILSALSLAAGHREDLRRRGLSDDVIDMHVYRSLRNTDRGAAARAAVGVAGEAAYRVPGVVYGEYGPTLWGTATGLVVPVRDPAGRVVALKVRRPDPAVPKYLYLSGPDDAAGPGSPPHVPVGTAAGGPVVRVTEGELKADVAAALTRVPTIGVAGVTQWAGALPLLPPAATVLVSFDAADVRDKPPVREQACRFVAALRAAGHAVELETWDGSHKGVDDLLAAGGEPRRLAGPALDRFLESAAADSSATADRPPAAAPVGAEAGPPVAARPPFPVDVFPGPLAEYAGKVAAAVGCPLDYVAVGMLTVAAAAVGAARAVRVKEGWLERPGLYAVLVGNPSTAKTPALKIVLKPVYEEQERLFADHAAARRRHEEDLERHAREARQTRREGEPPAKPVPPPPVRQLFVSDVTTEALAATLQRNPKGVLLFRDEMTAWVKSMDAYRGKGADAQFFLSAWSGEFVKVDRRLQLDNPVVVPHPFLCVLGGIQPDVLPDLDLERGRQDGFLPRLLFSCPTTGRTPRWSDEQVTESDEEPWRLAVSRLLNLQPVTPEGAGPRPRALPLSPEARAVYVSWFDRLADEMNAADFPPRLLAVYGKLRAYAARFALVLHLLHAAADPLTAGVGEGEVGADAVRGAVRVAEYFQLHGRVVHAALHQSPDDRGVDELVTWLRRTRRDGCAARDVCRAGVARVKNTGEANKLMREAADRGYGTLDFSHPAGGDNGLRAPRFRLNRPTPPDTPDSV